MSGFLLHRACVQQSSQIDHVADNWRGGHIKPISSSSSACTLLASNAGNGASEVKSVWDIVAASSLYVRSAYS